MMSTQIHLNQLQHFVCAAELGTISMAAKSLGVSQPTVTASIAKLEKTIGARLFYRNHMGVRVTPAGRILLRGAKGVLGKIESALKSIADLRKATAKSTSDVVKLGLMPQVAQVLLTPLVEQRMRQHPSINLVIEEAPGKTLIKMMEAGEVDLALSNVDGSNKLIAAEPIVVQRFYLMGSSKQASSDAPVRFVDLRDCPLIQGAMDGSIERRLTLERLATAKGMKLNFDVNSPVTIRKQLMQTLGRHSVSLYFQFMQEITSGEIVARPICDPTLIQYLYLMRRKQKAGRSVERIAYDLVKSQVHRMIRQRIYRWYKPGQWLGLDAIELDAAQAYRH